MFYNKNCEGKKKYTAGCVVSVMSRRVGRASDLNITSLMDLTMYRDISSPHVLYTNKGARRTRSVDLTLDDTLGLPRVLPAAHLAAPERTELSLSFARQPVDVSKFRAPDPQPRRRGRRGRGRPVATTAAVLQAVQKKGGSAGSAALNESSACFGNGKSPVEDAKQVVGDEVVTAGQEVMGDAWQME